MRSSAAVGITPPNVDGAAKPILSGALHLAFSASEMFVGFAVSDWPLPYAVLTYRSPSFVIFVVQPVFQVITAELPSSFQVPVIPSPRVAFAAPSLDSVISNGCPAVSFTFHTPSKALAARAAKPVTTTKQVTVTAAVAAFLIFVPPCKVKSPWRKTVQKKSLGYSTRMEVDPGNCSTQRGPRSILGV